jgi:hypothetical protein
MEKKPRWLRVSESIGLGVWPGTCLSMTTEEFHSEAVRVLNQMVKGGWLVDYCVGGTGDYRLNWTATGQKAWGLRTIVDTFKLLCDDRAAAAFDLMVHSNEPPPAYMQGSHLHPVLIPFWRERVAELGLHGDQKGLFALAQIVAKHVPA